MYELIFIPYTRRAVQPVVLVRNFVTLHPESAIEIQMALRECGVVPRDSGVILCVPLHDTTLIDTAWLYEPRRNIATEQFIYPLPRLMVDYKYTQKVRYSGRGEEVARSVGKIIAKIFFREEKTKHVYYEPE